MNIKITEKMVWNKLCNIERQVLLTNGKVKLNRWIASTAMGGWFITLGKVMFF